MLCRWCRVASGSIRWCSEGDKMDKYLLAVLVDNKPGVLTHIAGLISRRAFNIESISAGYT